MDDLLLKRADGVLADNEALRADVREKLLRARIQTARIRATVLIIQAERARYDLVADRNSDDAVTR